LINKERLWARLMELGEIGKQDSGGVTRFSFTTEERLAKDLVTSYMKEAGMTVREDAVGNLIGRKEGEDSKAPLVMLGSHIDTVPHGGKFDGALGVLAGIEAVQAMNEQNLKHLHPIEVIAYTDEEGSRFHFGMTGSRAVAGNLNEDDLLNIDGEGVSIATAMRSVGLNPEHILQAKKNPEDVKAYLELHIEQGRVLENNDLPVGIVTGIAGPFWTKWTLTGESGHAGATPMGIRKDPLTTAGLILSNIEEEAMKYPDTVATVGQFAIKPGGINVIPSHSIFTLDLRDVDESTRDIVESTIKENATRICNERDVKLEIETMQRIKPAICSESIQQIIKNACSKNNVSPFTLPSGAGHDGMQFGELCPFGMIFIRSKNGVSHNPEEWSSKEDCAKGTEVLYDTLLELVESILGK